MKRYSYLWGTKGKDYTEIGRTEGLDDFLRSNEIAAHNPGRVISEIMKMLGDFQISVDMIADYKAQEERPLNIRYAPMHLYKKTSFPDNMKPFAALCVNGLEPANLDGIKEQRETYYKYVTILSKKRMLGEVDGYNYLDQIFGTKMLSFLDNDEYRKGNEEIPFDYIPEKRNEKFLQGEDIQRDWDLISLVMGVLYQGADWRVVIKLRPEDNIKHRGLMILEKIYSMLPPMMAFETGFSLYEKPESIIALADNVNTRIFVISGNSMLENDKHLPSNTLLIDLNKKPLQKLYDSAFMDAVMFWSKMSWKDRQQAMEKLFVDSSRFFLKSYYIEVTKSFSENAFFADQNKKMIIPNPRMKRNEFLEELVNLVNQYSVEYGMVTQIPWVKELYKKRVERNLPEDVNITSIKKRLEEVKLEFENDDTLSSEEHENCGEIAEIIGNWLSELWNNPVEDERAKYEWKLEKQDINHKKEISMRQASFDEEKTRLISVHQTDLAQKDQEIQDAEEAHQKALVQKNQEIQDAEEAHQKALAQKNQEIQDAEEAHQTALAQKNQEIHDVKEAYQTALTQKDAEITGQKNQYEAQILSLKNDAKNALENQKNGFLDQLSSIESALNMEKQEKQVAQKAAADAKAAKAQLEKERDEIAVKYNNISGTPSARMAKDLEEKTRDYNALKDKHEKAKSHNEELFKKFKILVIAVGTVAVIALMGDIVCGVNLAKKNSLLEDANEQIEQMLAVAETEAPTEAITEAVTEVPTEVPTEAATEESTEVESESMEEDEEGRIAWKKLAKAADVDLIKENLESYKTQATNEEAIVVAVLKGTEWAEGTQLVIEEGVLVEGEASEHSIVVGKYVLTPMGEEAMKVAQASVKPIVKNLKKIDLDEIFAEAYPEGVNNWTSVILDQVTCEQKNETILNKNGNAPKTIPVAICTIGETSYAIYQYQEADKVLSLRDNWDNYTTMTGKDELSVVLELPKVESSVIDVQETENESTEE